jgi:hypothetical protein
VARIEQPAEAAPTVQGEAVSIGPGVEAGPVIWTARLRTGHVVIFQASAFKGFRAVASIVSVAAEDLEGIDSGAPAAVDSAATDSVVAVGLAAAGLAGLAAAAAGSGAGAEN